MVDVLPIAVAGGAVALALSGKKKISPEEAEKIIASTSPVEVEMKKREIIELAAPQKVDLPDIPEGPLACRKLEGPSYMKFFAPSDHVRARYEAWQRETREAMDFYGKKIRALQDPRNPAEAQPIRDELNRKLSSLRVTYETAISRWNRALLAAHLLSRKEKDKLREAYLKNGWRIKEVPLKGNVIAIYPPPTVEYVCPPLSAVSKETALRVAEDEKACAPKPSLIPPDPMKGRVVHLKRGQEYGFFCRPNGKWAWGARMKR